MGLKRAEPTLIRAPLRPMSLTSLSKCTPAHGEGPPGLESPTFQSAVHVAHTYMSSWKSSKEGGLPLCILWKREILRETIPRH